MKSQYSWWVEAVVVSTYTTGSEITDRLRGSSGGQAGGNEEHGLHLDDLFVFKDSKSVIVELVE